MCPLAKFRKQAATAKSCPQETSKVTMVSQYFSVNLSDVCTATLGIRRACHSLRTSEKAWPQHIVLSSLHSHSTKACASPCIAANRDAFQIRRSCAAAVAAAALVLLHPLTAAAQVNLVQDLQAQPQGVHCHLVTSSATAPGHRPTRAVNPLASTAGIFGLQNPEDDGDTAGPFSVQGQTRKKYIIERKDGEKVVARKQGITTSTCLTARPLLGDQSASAPSQTCKQAEEKTVDQACANSCQEACRSSISEFTEAREKFSGFVSQPQERDKITRACTRRCVYECKKPADGYIFEVNTRR